ncbi:pyruvate kinase [Candidatus Termititenax persephonae]|uniref:Pyruvate kinase n=1 Tax=Candidatus Termititenax persephonae TaxID=2218525 RepID=A0A388TIV9_9BACT|nr:pyruvate kinase [Candidatus Termititenax persephonae]
MLEKLLAEGVNVFRFNFSHQDYDNAAAACKNIRAWAEKNKVHVALFIDLQGPKIRIGKFQNGQIVLQPGQDFILTIEDVLGDEQMVSTTYQPIVKDAEPGHIILLDDGKLRLEVLRKDKTKVYTRVLNGGVLSNRKGMNLPGMKLSTPSLTDKDKEDVLRGLRMDVDYFALSFVRTAQDVLDLRSFLRANDSEHKIIAKIEKPEAVENIDAIVAVSDAVMVARGDLGVELSIEKVPSLQKDIIRRANYGGVPVIVATQMLESMINSPLPTRAEVSDVATAIYDWADAVMLSGETAMGKYPLETVQLMGKVAMDVDITQSERKKKLLMRKTHFIQENSMLSSLCDSADELADELNAKAIITFSDSGRTPLLLSKYRSSVPIIAISDQLKTCSKMALYRGVIPLLCHTPFARMSGIKQMLQEAEQRSKEAALLKDGDLVVIMAGIPIATAGSTNMIRVHRIGTPY